MTAFIQPFDFRKIFLNYFLGSSTLFFGAFIIIYSYVAAKLQMSNRIFFVTLVIGSIMFAGILGEAMYVLVFLIIGFISFKILGKILT